MHQTHLLEKILQYLDKEEKSALRRIKKVYISLSEFGGINENHFKGCLKEKSRGSRWESLDIEVRKVAYGPELEITRLDFE
jgi:Zn finger protein HypA/HybF involved in hydrogenase expression